jgi:hypothetical protein
MTAFTYALVKTCPETLPPETYEERITQLTSIPFSKLVSDN